MYILGFPDSSVGKESTYNARHPGWIPWLGRSPGEGKGYPLQYSGLENSIDCIVRGVTKSQIGLSDFHFTYQCSVLSRFSHIRLFETQWTFAHQALLSMGFSSKSTGVGCHFLLQGIFPTQGSNPGLPHYRQTLYRLSHQGSLRNSTNIMK